MLGGNPKTGSSPLSFHLVKGEEPLKLKIPQQDTVVTHKILSKLTVVIKQCLFENLWHCQKKEKTELFFQTTILYQAKMKDILLRLANKCFDREVFSSSSQHNVTVYLHSVSRWATMPFDPCKDSVCESLQYDLVAKGPGQAAAQDI